MATTQTNGIANVFSNVRRSTDILTQPILRNDDYTINQANTANGFDLLAAINNAVITASFFDPQYRGIMDKLNYGNEGERQKERAMLQQMDEETIVKFIREIDRVLVPSGHLFLWVDKFHLCEGINHWTTNTSLKVVDLITWDKGKIGTGYRTRRKSEYLLVLQKQPAKAKGHWTRHDIPDVWTEKISGKIHPHQKPLLLQKCLIDAVSAPGDFILDPCSGSYSIMEACKQSNRNFIGSDLKPLQPSLTVVPVVV